jgi:hypothetical protein
MDARALGARDLALLGRATGDAVMFASVVFRTILEHRDLDVQVLRDGHDYMVVLTEHRGDHVLAEHRMPVAWTEIDEATRFGVLAIYVAQILQGHERWRRTMNRKLAVLRVNLIPPPSDG